MSNPRLLLRAGLDAVGRVACARLLQSRTAPIVEADVRLAVPEKCCGLTLILAFFDRCGNCGFASSATGSARPQFPGGPHKYCCIPVGRGPVPRCVQIRNEELGMMNARSGAFPVCHCERNKTKSKPSESGFDLEPAQIASVFVVFPANSFRSSRRGGLRPPAVHYRTHRREASPDASGLDPFRTERGGIRGCLPASTRAEHSTLSGWFHLFFRFP